MTSKRPSRAPRSKRPRAGAETRPVARRSSPLLVAAVGALFGVVAIAALVIAIVPRIAKHGSGRPIDVDLAPGTTADDAIGKLQAAGVVDSPRLVALCIHLIFSGRIAPGRHLMSDDLSPLEVARRISGSSETARIKVTIPEGWNRFDIARRLEDRRVCDASAFLAATTDAALLQQVGLGDLGPDASAEGWLFPSTYGFAADSDPREVVRRMVAEAHARFDRLQRELGGDRFEPPWKALGWGPRQLMILASIVEKEAAADDERSTIASVFLNRLRDPSFTPRLLQADPTAMYGCWQSTLSTAPAPPSCVPWLAAGTGRASAEIQHDAQNRWSTYTHEGLPPTPISNPGEKSIAAAIAPAPTRFLYFVARGGGHHTFSETLAAHNRAVKPGATAQP